MDAIKDRIMALIDEFVAFLHELVNKYLGEVEIF